MATNSLFSPRTRHAGFSLVEVLVSIVVLCIGMLGMVALQANSLQANREARLQASAGALARELAELVRGNRSAALLTTGNPYLVSTSDPLVAATPSYCLVFGSNCTTAGATAIANATALGNAQMTEWLARVNKELPGARVVVCFDDTPYDTTAGLPEWPCSNTGTALAVKIGWTRGSLNRTGSTGPDRATASGSTPGVVLPLVAGWNGT